MKEPSEAAPRRTQVTPRDLAILDFLGRMRFATTAQLRRAFGMHERAVQERCRGLAGLGLARRERVLFGQPPVHLATAAGLGLAGCPLPPARIDLLNYRHHLAVVSLALDLLEGSPGARWLSERELRQGIGERAGVGAPVHVPDGVLLLPDGRRQAIELELTPKGGRRLAGILRFYARSRDYDEVRYFVPTPAAALRLRRLAAALDHVRAELWLPPEGVGPPGGAPGRAARG